METSEGGGQSNHPKEDCWNRTSQQVALTY